MPLTKKYRVVIADDHAIVRDALKFILDSRSEFEMVGEAKDGREATRVTNELLPDLLLLDLSMPRANGIEAIRDIRRTNRRTRILVLTATHNSDFIYEVIKAGADGYALKDIGSEELLTAIKAILSGEKFLSPSVTTTVLGGIRDITKTSDVDSPFELLSGREREILKLVAEGYRTRAIADYLCISPKTVERHRTNVMNRLNLHSVSALTSYAIKIGLVTQ